MDNEHRVEFPMMNVPVRNEAGIIIGQITISPEGTFAGRIENRDSLKALGRAFEYELAEGIEFRPIIDAVKPYIEADARIMASYFEEKKKGTFDR